MFFVVVGKPIWSQHIFFVCEGHGLNFSGPGITALKPEAGRSIPEQVEVALTSDGGP